MNNWRLLTTKSSFLLLFGIFFLGLGSSAVEAETALFNIYSDTEYEQIEQQVTGELTGLKEFDEKRLLRLYKTADSRGESEAARNYLLALLDRDLQEFEWLNPVTVHRIAGLFFYQYEDYLRAYQAFRKSAELSKTELEKENLKGWSRRSLDNFNRRLESDPEGTVKQLFVPLKASLEQGKTAFVLEKITQHQEKFDGVFEFDRLVGVVRYHQAFESWLDRVIEADNSTGREVLNELLEEGWNYYSQPDYQRLAGEAQGRVFYLLGSKRFVAGEQQEAFNDWLRAQAFSENERPEIIQKQANFFYLQGDYQRTREKLARLAATYPEFDIAPGLIWFTHFRANQTVIVLVLLLIGLFGISAFFLRAFQQNKVEESSDE